MDFLFVTCYDEERHEVFENRSQGRFLMGKIIKYFFGAVFFAAVLIVGYNSFKPAPLSLQERTMSANEWLSGLNDVYHAKHDDELLQYAERLEQHAILAAPDGNGFVLQKQPNADDYFLMVLSRGDTNAPWQELYERKDFATTWLTGSAGKKFTFVIVKNGQVLSSKTKGILLAHELVHEKVGVSEKNSCVGEAVAHTFSNKLWLGIGGDPYQKLLDARAKEYGEYLLNSKEKTVPLSYYSGELEKILGKSISPDEKLIRITSFEYASMFLATDKYYPGSDKMDQKGRMYCSVHPEEIE
ncbi:MAG: hypothetical protein M0P76_03520 [Candidatus Pacebacteria bacterium]|nr:hypothetical protein [Candidatus Paceibacterota bacterium]